MVAGKLGLLALLWLGMMHSLLLDFHMLEQASVVNRFREHSIFKLLLLVLLVWLGWLHSEHVNVVVESHVELMLLIGGVLLLLLL